MNIELLLKKTDLAKIKKRLSVEYIDVRVEKTDEARVVFQNGDIITAIEKPSVGAFIRVCSDSKWFYLATTNLEKLEQEIEGAVLGLKEMPQLDNKIHLPSFTGQYKLNRYEEFSYAKIALNDKVELIRGYVPIAQMMEHYKSSTVSYSDIYKMKYFMASNGNEFQYDFNQGGLVSRITLKDGEHLFEDRYQKYAVKFDDLRNLNDEIKDHFLKSKRFLYAKTIPPGKYKVLLSPEIAGVFTHESFGHKSEADFMLGDIKAIKEWEIGKVVSSECVSIIDNGGHENTSGYCPIDDEGYPAQKNYLIKNGKLAGRLHSTQTANVFNEAVTANARAMNFEFEPIVRMTSTYIESGKTTKDEILKLAEGGIYFDGVKYGTGGSTFTIAPLRGYRIKNGKLDEPVKASVISGSVFDTLKEIEAVGDDFELFSSAFGGCGKSEQWLLPVAAGGPTILVSQMQIS